MGNMQIKIKSFLKRKDADDNAKPWVWWYSRIGFSAKGSVYILIGLISMMAAVGIGQKSDQQGAIAAVAGKPFGEVVLWLVVLGLIGYIAWLITQIIMEPDHRMSNMKVFFIRIGYLFTAAFYVGIGVRFAILAMQSGQTSDTKQIWMEKVLDIPIGRLAIAITGISIFVFAVIQLILGIRGSFTKKLNTNQMKRKEMIITNQIGRIGFIARGITFGVLGGFLVHSGWSGKSSQATGIDGALAQIAQEPFGQALLGVVSLGLFLYGVYEVLEGKNRNIKVSDK